MGSANAGLKSPGVEAAQGSFRLNNGGVSVVGWALVLATCARRCHWGASLSATPFRCHPLEGVQSQIEPAVHHT